MKKKESGNDMYKSFTAKVKKMKKGEPFLATFTIFDKQGDQVKELETFLFINNFPYEEIPGTKDKIVKLIDEVK
ncbi:MAG: hypothetical protein PHT44_00755 [Candidatus Portnoybacteria bacterium]|nr:hypothetical protein [Candidatus Portnoybacteria bacterium]MDD4982855.1 hypothetical protein [Candidatus Portnoybacteria bacterium]